MSNLIVRCAKPVASLLLLATACSTRYEDSPTQRIDVYDGFETPGLSKAWETTGFVPGGVTMQTEIARSGRSALKIVVHSRDKFEAGINGDNDSERAELKEARRLMSKENVTYEQSFSVFFPTDFPIVRTRLVIAQWKQQCPERGNCENDCPVVSIRYASGVLKITHQTGAVQKSLFKVNDDLRGKWIDFRFQTRFSTNANGRILAWLNDRQVVDYTGVNAYPESAATGYPIPSRFYFRMGLYRDVMAEPMTIYIDEYRKSQLPDD